MSGPGRRTFLLVFLGLSAPAAPLAALQTTAVLRLHNDFFDFWRSPTNRPDEEYTQGGELTLRWPRGITLPFVAPSAPRCEKAVSREMPCGHLGLSLGQDIYTPSRDSAHLIRGQRPYAGWLYLALTGQVESARRLDAVRVTLGVTGPPSLAQALQEGWHDLFGYRRPLGWKEQLPFEPAFAVSWSGARALGRPPQHNTALIVAPGWNLTAGTLRTAAELGVRATFGSPAPPPWHPTSRRRQSEGTGFYFIAGAQAELVARDEFLDGTLFRESQSVDRRWLVGQVEGGAGLTLGRVRLEWAVIHRSREYRTQPAPHTFARIQLGWD